MVCANYFGMCVELRNFGFTYNIKIIEKKSVTEATKLRPELEQLFNIHKIKPRSAKVLGGVHTTVSEHGSPAYVVKDVTELCLDGFGMDV
jgi:hypothetical protein